MIKKLLFAAPLALAAGALFTTPASAADWNNHNDRQQTEVRYANGHDRDGRRDNGREFRETNRLRDGHRDRKDCAHHEYGRQSHERRHHDWRSDRR